MIIYFCFYDQGILYLNSIRVQALTLVAPTPLQSAVLHGEAMATISALVLSSLGAPPVCLMWC